ncbi:MAG TPA: sugar transferase, partial [Anaerolineae bacterium]|nr:sugar transferase [Anaerolineae bacterium]
MLNQQNLPNQSLLLKIKPNFSIRLLDLLVAIPGLILLAPIFGLIAAAIKLTSPGSVFYLATRVGQDGQLFKLYKFRTMVANADRQGPGITTHNDARITPVGRFLRQTKLDELPQLINVVRGEMSLVGPRPEDPRYVELYTPEQRQVLQVRPGLTSLASLYYHYEETLLAGPNWEKQYREQLLPHKLALDLAYLRKRSFWSDLGVMLRTVVAISRGDNSVQFILKLRNRHFFVLDILLLLLLPALALTLRLDGMGRWAVSSQALIVYTITALVVKLTIFYRCRLYARYWRYASIHDLILVALAVSLSTVALTVLFIILHPLLMPYGLAVYRTVPIIDGLLTLFAIAGLRLGLRGLYHFH